MTNRLFHLFKKYRYIFSLFFSVLEVLRCINGGVGGGAGVCTCVLKGHAAPCFSTLYLGNMWAFLDHLAKDEKSANRERR